MFKASPSIKSCGIDKRIAVFLLLGIIFVFILTLFGLALAELENEGFSFVEINRTNRTRGILSTIIFLLGFQLGFFALIPSYEFLRGLIGEKRFSEKIMGLFALILLFEYLRGHIGEKRFSERTIYVGFPFHMYPLFLTTARFGPSFVFNWSEEH